MKTNTANRSNAYSIFVRSNEHPRTVNTPSNGRTCYSVITVSGKDAFIAKINELHRQGVAVSEVRYGVGCSYVKYWEYIAQ